VVGGWEGIRGIGGEKEVEGDDRIVEGSKQ